MRCDFLVEAIGNIDLSIIDEAEVYKPARKNHAWIWAASSAACVCLAVLMIFSHSFGKINSNACLKFPFAAVPVHGYVDYSETAEQGKVTITDELRAQLDKCNEFDEPRGLFVDSTMCGYIFPVHITDADGASRFHLYKNCLEPLNLGEANAEDFLRDGTLMLTKKQIYSLKCPSTCTVIIAPSMIILDEEYLGTVTLDTLNVRVYPHSWNHALGDDPYDQDGEIKRIKEFFDKYAEDNKIPRGSIKEYYENTGCFTAELDKETISRLLADERTEMVCMITDG